MTDDFDRRLLHSYINTTFCPDAIGTPFYKLVHYCIFVVDSCNFMLVIEKPIYFGLSRVF